MIREETQNAVALFSPAKFTFETSYPLMCFRINTFPKFLARRIVRNSYYISYFAINCVAVSHVSFVELRNYRISLNESPVI